MPNSMPYKGQKEYELHVAGLTRKLPVVSVANGELYIAAFIMLGDTEVNKACAKALASRFPKDGVDVVVVPETKAIALGQSLGEYLSKDQYVDYVVLRKSVKSYTKDPIIVEVQSITTAGKQILVLDASDAEKMKGKRIAIIDDVVSTGGTFGAMAEIVRKLDANTVYAGAVLKEGDFDLSAIEKSLSLKIDYLAELPVFVP